MLGSSEPTGYNSARIEPVELRSSTFSRISTSKQSGTNCKIVIITCKVLTQSTTGRITKIIRKKQKNRCRRSKTCHKISITLNLMTRFYTITTVPSSRLVLIPKGLKKKHINTFSIYFRFLINCVV